MATTKKDNTDDMSMQEILESIRKYVIEDAKPLPSSETKKEKDLPTKGITNPKTTPVELYDADDVIELTDPMASGKKTPPPAPPKVRSAPPEPSPLPEPSLPPEKVKAVEPEPEPEPEKPTPKPETPPPLPPQTQTSVRSSRIAEALLSQQAVSSSAQAFSRLYEASKPSAAAARPPQTTQATQATLEQAVLELARPMLQGWLNENLPRLVETLVAREIEKITRNDLNKK